MFLDKRDEKGQLLSFKAFAISEEVAELGIKNFKKTRLRTRTRIRSPEETPEEQKTQEGRRRQWYVGCFSEFFV